MIFSEISKEEKMWGFLCHLSFFSTLLIPFGNFICPIAIWLYHRDKSEFINLNGKAVINFQLTCLVVGLICWLLSFIYIGIIIAVIWFIYAFLEIIMACVKSNRGEVFEYSLSFQFLK